jgi:hypothetical protein
MGVVSFILRPPLPGQVPIGQDAGWAPEPVWALCSKENLLALDGTRTSARCYTDWAIPAPLLSTTGIQWTTSCTNNLWHGFLCFPIQENETNQYQVPLIHKQQTYEVANSLWLRATEYNSLYNTSGPNRRSLHIDLFSYLVKETFRNSGKLPLTA